jgi:cyclopropane fatty-acyl-phospholipid synthase-like methyltransferase
MKDYIHKEFPKSCDPNDFFAQVKRTVNGKPVSQEQINMIIDSIVNGLKFKKEDVLFDLGCGNGALSVMMFSLISKYHGVDFSEYLTEIANKNFAKTGFTFECAEAGEFMNTISNNSEYTKGLCYGVFSYFEREKAFEILNNICIKFKNIERFYIGNIPDKDRADKFYFKDIDYSKLIDDNQSSIGIWWTKDEFSKLANDTGWNIEFYNMPEHFYSAHYRFDVILTRKK